MKRQGGHIGKDRFAFIDGEVTDSRAREIAEHLAACSKCRDEMESARLTCQAIASTMTLSAPPVDFTFSVLQRIAEAPGRTSGLDEALGNLRDSLSRLFGRVIGSRMAFGAAGAAAILVIALLLPGLLSTFQPRHGNLDPHSGVGTSSAIKWPPAQWTAYSPAFYGLDYSLERIGDPFDVRAAGLPEGADPVDALQSMGSRMPGGSGNQLSSTFGSQLLTLQLHRGTAPRPKGHEEAAQRTRNINAPLRTLTPADPLYPTVTPFVARTRTPTPARPTSTPAPPTRTPNVSPTVTATPLVASRMVFIPQGIPGKPGQRVRAPVSVTEVKGIASADLSIHYDPAILAYEGVQTSIQTEGFFIARNPSTMGLLKVSLSRNEPIRSLGPGTLIFVEFLIRDTVQPGATTELGFGRVLLFDEDGNPLGTTVRRGSVTVE